MTSSNHNPAIVVIGFNRPNSIRRLLESIAQANFTTKVTLVVSIDFCDSQTGKQTREVAQEFNWPHGEKRLILHEENLGLRKHVLSCGDLSTEYESVIVLEDDLTVGPEFYSFAVAGLDFSDNQMSVGGVSLYDHRTNFVCQLPFQPVDDGFDNYYLQIASSWGQAWAKRQWTEFRHWYDALGERNQGNDSVLETIPTSAPIPRQVANWPKSSWLKYFIWYLAETNKLFLYPRTSHATNHSDSGTHVGSSTHIWQVPLAMKVNELRFSSPDDSLAVYDSYFELKPKIVKQLSPSLEQYDFDVDFYGTKQVDKLLRPLVLTSRTASSSELEFDLARKPFVANLQTPSQSSSSSKFRLTNPGNINGESQLSLNDVRNIEYFYGAIPLRTVAKNLISYFWQKKR